MCVVCDVLPCIIIQVVFASTSVCEGGQLSGDTLGFSVHRLPSSPPSPTLTAVSHPHHRLPSSPPSPTLTAVSHPHHRLQSSPPSPILTTVSHPHHRLPPSPPSPILTTVYHPHHRLPPSPPSTTLTSVSVFKRPLSLLPGEFEELLAFLQPTALAGLDSRLEQCSGMRASWYSGLAALLERQTGFRCHSFRGVPAGVTHTVRWHFRSVGRVFLRYRLLFFLQTGVCC